MAILLFFIFLVVNVFHPISFIIMQMIHNSCRMTTFLENLEMSGNFIVDREMSGNWHFVWEISGKISSAKTVVFKEQNVESW